MFYYWLTAIFIRDNKLDHGQGHPKIYDGYEIIYEIALWII